jgi:hypothetical protein
MKIKQYLLNEERVKPEVSYEVTVHGKGKSGTQAFDNFNSADDYATRMRKKSPVEMWKITKQLVYRSGD